MAGFLDKLQEILSAVARLAEMERRQSATTRELRDDLRRIEQRFGEIDRRLTVVETRQEGLAAAVASEARAAAQSAAALAVGGHLAVIAERLARIEIATPQTRPGRSRKRALPPPEAGR